MGVDTVSGMDLESVSAGCQCKPGLRGILSLRRVDTDSRPEQATRQKGDGMDRIHPVTAALTLLAIGLTAEWAINREDSLVAKLIGSLGG